MKVKLRLLLITSIIFLSCKLIDAPAATEAPVTEAPNGTPIPNQESKPTSPVPASETPAPTDLAVVQSETASPVPFLPENRDPISPQNISLLQPAREIPVPAVYSLSFSPDNRYLALLSENPDRSRCISVWDLQSGEQVLLVEVWDKKPVNLLRSSGEFLVAVMQARPNFWWDPIPDAYLPMLQAAGSHAGLSPDMETLVLETGYDSTDFKTSLEILRAGEKQADLTITGILMGVSFLPDFDLLILHAGGGASQPPAVIWDLSNGAVVGELEDISSGDFSNDLRWFASNYQIGTYIQVLSLPDWEREELLGDGTDTGFGQVYFSPSGELLTARYHGDIRFWQLQDWAEVGSLSGNTSAYTFSPDGTMIATADYANGITLWLVER